MVVHRIGLLASVAAGLFSVSVANAAVVGPIADPYGNDNLYVVSPGTWTADEAAAKAMGGNLVTIHSAAEDSFIVSNILKDFTSSGGPNLSNVPAWIGYYDSAGAVSDDGPGGPGTRHAADFVWADGETPGYTNWASIEPNDGVTGEYYAAINWYFAAGGGRPAGDWDDTPNAGTRGSAGNTDGPYYGIVAVAVPEPSTLFISTVALMMTCGRRRSRQGKAAR